MPRPEHLRPPNYAEQFDDDTLLYDVFRRDNQIILIGPSLIEDERLAELIDNIQINQTSIKSLNYACYVSHKIFKIIIDNANPDWDSINIYHKQLPVRRSPYENMKPNKVLCTKQKDNEIVWIKDWILWYHSFYDIDLVVIYDNASTRYSVEELKASLSDMPCSVIVESFPFKFGPQAWEMGKWDSDFCEYAIYEHIRYYVCGNQGYFFNFDIDELLIFKEFSSINWNKTKYNGIHFRGKWAFLDIKHQPNHRSKIKHASHSIVDKEYISGRGKYIALLNKLAHANFLNTHQISNPQVIYYKPSKAFYLHFHSISTNWKYDRAKTIDFNPQIHDRINIKLVS
ncbi:hypothetical protein [Candidatus Albibeggiatoa sp. nov. BB20]|uniref:hypothetical protein n=1 Tax=Candidatus Albibeggiatoa sp. nov. BB20 TaxID=3162723 RepID=UPI0033659A78